MDGVPKTLRHFLTTAHASIHKGQAALYGLVSSAPLITPISYPQFRRNVTPELAEAVAAFATAHDLTFGEKDSIGYDVLYTDMNNMVANFFFLTSVTGKTVFANTDGYIELVEIPDPDGVSAPAHMWR
jgi:hypothetical protein